MMETISNEVGVVVIGRNEGQRLITCLKSLKQDAKKIVYVDSGSTDGSLNAAAKLDVTVVNLNMSLPFTAARARNSGWRALIDLEPALKYVQFVDGDCEVVTGWLPFAYDYLESNPEVAVVCGRRRERFPEASVYNQLCDIEWDTPIGETKACGGDAMMRIHCLIENNGYNETLIAGEEPELCIRIRRAGFKVWRLDHEMTLHDAAIMKLSQWWKRTTRAGYAYAEGAYLHGKPPERHWVVESRRSWLWGLLIPILFLTSILIGSAFAYIFIVLYLFQYTKLIRNNKRFDSFASTYARYLMLGKTAEALGQLKYWWHRLLNKKTNIIEYK